MTNKTVRNDEIVALARAGVSYNRIAALNGLTRQRVQQLARAAGISRNPERRPHTPNLPRVLTEADLECLSVLRLIRLLEKGWLTPGYRKGTPAEREHVKQALLAMLRAHLAKQAVAS